MKTVHLSHEEALQRRRWYLIDAKGKTLGRLASEVAKILRGKHKPEYSPHVDVGDFVIVINAKEVKVTGRKMEKKLYHRHSGHPGHLKTFTLRWMLEHRPERVIELAVWGMMPRNRLSRRQIRKLKVYAGPQHPHAAQQPVEWKIPERP